jgi:pimeloyl-ACP methyl ester carboxylesterase
MFNQELIIDAAFCSGTYGAAMYANKYPQNVGRFVLDAVFPHGVVSLLYRYDLPKAHRMMIGNRAICKSILTRLEPLIVFCFVPMRIAFMI